jgi:hypothetical protein
MGSFITCTHAQISISRLNKYNEVGGACGRHWRGHESAQGFDEKPKGQTPLRRLRSRWEDRI